jgi:hypothetical protein
MDTRQRSPAAAAGNRPMASVTPPSDGHVWNSCVELLRARPGLVGADRSERRGAEPRCGFARSIGELATLCTGELVRLETYHTRGRQFEGERPTGHAQRRIRIAEVRATVLGLGRFGANVTPTLRQRVERGGVRDFPEHGDRLGELVLHRRPRGGGVGRSRARASAANACAHTRLVVAAALRTLEGGSHVRIRGLRTRARAERQRDTRGERGVTRARDHRPPRARRTLRCRP